MRCPNCKLINPESALRCDCGYDFPTGKIKESYLQKTLLASRDERFLGQILDSFVAIAAVLLIPAILYLISDTLGMIATICGLLFAVFYLLFADGFSGGQSYGKRIMKTAVVDASTGQPCTFGKSFVRNLLLLVLGIIDWIFIFGGKRQRLGDMAANTLVVKKSA